MFRKVRRHTLERSVQITSNNEVGIVHYIFKLAWTKASTIITRNSRKGCNDDYESIDRNVFAHLTNIKELENTM